MSFLNRNGVVFNGFKEPQVSANGIDFYDGLYYITDDWGFSTYNKNWSRGSLYRSSMSPDNTGILIIPDYMFLLHNDDDMYKFNIQGTVYYNRKSVSRNTIAGVRDNKGYMWLLQSSNNGYLLQKVSIINLTDSDLITINYSSGVPIDVCEKNGDLFVVFNDGMVQAYSTLSLAEKVALTFSAFEVESPIGICANDDGDIIIVDSATSSAYSYTLSSFTFDGDFTTLSEDDFASWVAPTILVDNNTVASLNVGVGVEAIGDGNIYIPSTHFNYGDVIAIKDENGKTLVEHQVDSVIVDVMINTGFVYLLDDLSNKVTDQVLGETYLKVSSGDIVPQVFYMDGNIITSDDLLLKLSSLLFNFRSNHLLSSQSGLPINIEVKEVCNDVLYKRNHGYNVFITQQGEQRKTGYYESTVTVSDIPKPNVRVLCLMNNGRLVDETYSDEDGKYRFDDLLLNVKYLFIAQYNNGNQYIEPEYMAAAADWQSPTPYGS